jgi:cytochrome c-type biogenesis protein CcmF
MPDIQYIGENLIPRYFGHVGIVLSFVAALLAAYAYFMATQNRLNETLSNSWRSIGRWAFGVHGVSVMMVIGTIFYVMVNKRYEYFYTHSHVDDHLEFRYLFCAFWEGQEGSFLLWTFWHVGLGAFLILRGGKRGNGIRDSESSSWESPVLSVLATIQVFLASMVLGLHFGWGEHIIKWGSNPILLLRETMDAPIFQQADYISKIKLTARGLNTSLQNGWMLIHPPTLFLGFASTAIPFCFAVAGMWTKRYTEWLRPALPYALFSATILGTGVSMGGMWAYEALSFNGYWAWDPVENTSLVPWLVILAGLHTHLVARATGHSVRATAIFYILTFLFTVYSTYLTRSGILGDTSAHAFTEMGLEWQLVLFQAFYVLLSAYLLIKHFKNIPSPQKEEGIASREFWMFIGSLVLILSVVFITFTTSIPVYNKIGGYFAELFKFKAPRLTSPVEPIAHYNKTQLWIGVFMALLSATAQFLRYKEFNFQGHQKIFFKHIGITLGISAVLTALAANYWIEAKAWQYILLLFTGIFTLVSNIDYALVFFKGNPKASGSAVSHVGFGFLILGILATGLNKKWISSNRFAMEGLVRFTDEQYDKNVLLIKGSPLTMKGYEVLYESDTTMNARRFFTLKFKKKSDDLKTDVDSFTLRPFVHFDKRTGKVSANNPATKHFWNYDIFTIVSSLPPGEQDPEIAHQEEDSLKYVKYDIPKTEVFTPKNLNPKTPAYTVEIEGLDNNPNNPKYLAEEKDVAVGVKLRFNRGKDTVYRAMPIVLLRGENIYQLPATINELGLRVQADPALFDRIFMPDKALKFKDYVLKEGGTVTVGDKTVSFAGVNPQATPQGFTTKEGDLALGLKLNVAYKGASYETEPVYVIRGNTPIPLQSEIETLGMHFAISKIDPVAKTFTLQIAEKDPKSLKLPISIAEDAPRNDYIVLEATVNPGINYVWTGICMMMIGLAMALFYRLKQ